MARPSKAAAPSFSSAQAVHILERALADKKLTSADIKAYLASLGEEISTLEARLARLKAAVITPVVAAVKRLRSRKSRGGDPPFPKNSPVKPAKKRKKPISSERRASMKLQGEYLGLMSGIPKSKRASYKAIAKKDGREKAISAMKMAQGK